jgi:hypothetical protein
LTALHFQLLMSLTDVSTVKLQFPNLRRVDMNEIIRAPADVIVSNGKSQFFVFNTEYAVSLRRENAMKEISIIRQAEGLSIPVVGVVVDGSIVDGYVMPLASPIPTDIPVELKTKL